MSGGFLRTLAKVGLVELSQEERTKLDVEESKTLGKDDPVSEHRSNADEYSGIDTFGAEASESPSSTSEVIFEKELASIYQEANLVSVSYAAEKLLRVLDGLKAMDPDSRKIAVAAMDAADDSWTIQDPVQDAQNKMKALSNYKVEVQAHMTREEKTAELELRAQDEYQTKAAQTIREEIAALEKRLEEEIQKVAETKARIQTRLERGRDALRRENRRLDQEIIRLRTLPELFGDTQKV